MRPFAKRVLVVGVLLIVPILLSGCIVCIDDVFNDNRPPRMATLSVYALDYYSGMPIPWAEVELYESHWWTWDYQGTWPVGPSGHTYLRCGYLYPEGCGGKEEETYRVVVYASGYEVERFDIELSYYYPSETLSFYLLPRSGREAVDVEPGTLGIANEDAQESGLAHGKVVVGEPGAAADE
jgi:hypothetical protein